MRLTLMNRFALAVAPALFLALLVPAHAQYSAPPNTGNTFKDTSMLKPPAGAKVAIFTFEDLECPACARAFPMVQGAIEHYKIPLVRHDFPLRMHLWSFDAAVNARYLQDKVSPKTAEEYRGAVFAAQNSIASKEGQGDHPFGERIRLTQTPTIWVVTQKNWIQVTDPTQLFQTIDSALAQTASSSTAANSKLRHPATPQK